jgi:tetratricopeptide (TPR) repeat protein
VLVQRRGFAAVRASLAAPSRDVLDLAATLLTTQGDHLPHREKANLSLSTTLSLSLDGLSAAGRDLLRLAAQLAPAPIPRPLIVGAFAAADGAPAGDAEDAADLGLAAAAAESLVREPAPNQVLVHSLVSRAMRLRDAGQQARWEQLRSGAVAALDDVLDEGVEDVRQHRHLAAAAVHARAVLEPAMDSGSRLGSLEGRLLDGLYVYDMVRGNYREARRIADRLILNATEVLGPEHQYTLIFMSYVGAVLLEQGRLTEALAEHERIYEIRRRTLGAAHRDTLKSMSDAALVLYKQGALEQARQIQERVLAARLELFGRRHLDVATAMNNLAATLSDVGDTGPALELQREVVGIRRDLLGADHAETLAALGNLAVIQRAAGDTATARANQDDAFDRRPDTLDDRHPHTLTALHNRAATLYSQGDLASARDAAERCLSGRRDVLGGDHPDTLATQNNLGAILMTLRDDAAAAELLDDALERCRRTLGPQHPATFQAAYHLVLTLARAGDPGRRVPSILEQDLAPLAARDPASLPPELREARARLLPMLSRTAPAPAADTPWWRRLLRE